MGLHTLLCYFQRKSQNLESQRLKTKRTVDESSSDEEDKTDPKDKAFGDNDDVEIFKSVVKPSKSSKEQIFKSIDPNNFVQSTIKSVDEFKDSEDEEEDEQDEFDIATVDSGIELEKKNEKKELKVLPGELKNWYTHSELKCRKYVITV